MNFKTIQGLSIPILFTIIPICAFLLFQNGWWMLVCVVMQLFALGAYVIFTMMNFTGLTEHKNAKGSDVLLYSFAASMILPSYILVLFPFFMESSKFLNKINYIFGAHFQTIYEGGLIVGFITIAYIVYSLFAVAGIFSTSLSLIKKGKTKPLMYGWMCTAFVCLAVFTAYNVSLTGFDASLYPSSYETQMQKEEHEIDQQIEADKYRLIQKAVNDYRRQSE